MNQEAEPTVLDAAECIRIRGGADPQPAESRPRHSPRPTGGHHRAQRIGEELAGLRHALRRRATAVYRKPFGLRPAVPPSARTSRRRPDRGPAADDFHRPAGGGQNPRSTVATVTEIYDYLRLLYARLGEPSCHRCGAAIRQQIARADPRRPDGPARRHAGDDPGPAGPRPQGASTRKFSRASARRGCCGRGSTARWSTSTIRPPWFGRSRTISRR